MLNAEIPTVPQVFFFFHQKIIYIYILLHVDLIGQLHVYTGQHLKLFKSHNDHSLFNTMQRIIYAKSQG